MVTTEYAVSDRYGDSTSFSTRPDLPVNSVIRSPWGMGLYALLQEKFSRHWFDLNRLPNSTENAFFLSELISRWFYWRRSSTNRGWLLELNLTQQSLMEISIHWPVIRMMDYVNTCMKAFQWRKGRLRLHWNWGYKRGHLLCTRPFESSMFTRLR